MKSNSVEGRRASFAATSYQNNSTANAPHLNPGSIDNANSGAIASFSNSRSLDTLDDHSNVRSSLKFALGADGEVIYLRPEVENFLQLLKENFTFESAYSLYLTALTTTPASGDVISNYSPSFNKVKYLTMQVYPEKCLLRVLTYNSWKKR